MVHQWCRNIYNFKKSINLFCSTCINQFIFIHYQTSVVLRSRETVNWAIQEEFRFIMFFWNTLLLDQEKVCREPLINHVAAFTKQRLYHKDQDMQLSIIHFYISRRFWLDFHTIAPCNIFCCRTGKGNRSDNIYLPKHSPKASMHVK